MQAVSLAKCLFIKDSSREGYANKIFEPDTVSDEEDEGPTEVTSISGGLSCDRDVALNTFDVEDSEVSRTLRNVKSGPFNRVTPSMWPQDILNGSSSSLDSSQPLEPYKFDKFGFLLESDVSDEEDSSKTTGIMETVDENNLRSKWISFLEVNCTSEATSKMKWSQVDVEIRRSKTLEELVSLGLPHTMRAQLWLRLSRGALYASKSRWPYSEMVERAKTEVVDEQEATRILANNACFMSSESIGTLRLCRVLKVLQWFRRMVKLQTYHNLEYINIPLVTAYLLLLCEEEEVFWLVFAISREWQSLNHQIVLKELIAAITPEVDEVIKENDIEISLITGEWFTSLFATFFTDCNLLYRLWDLYFYYGPVVFFQLFLATLNSQRDLLVEASDAASLFNGIEELPSTITSIIQLTDLIQTGQLLVPHIKMSTDGISHRTSSIYANDRSGSESSSRRGSIAGDSDNLRKKNIVQTSLLIELHESIAAIAHHFETHDPRFKANLQVDLKENEVGGEETDSTSLDSLTKGPRLAKALIDFQRSDPDELGFKKHDIITVLSERDEHCWVGELNGIRGWFPAKFVEVLERNDDYSAAGDDGVVPFINDLVRGRLSSSLKQIMSHGLKKGRLILTHPWTVLEEVASACTKSDFNSVYSRLVLTKTYRLDDITRVLTPPEILFKNISYINETHKGQPLDIKLRSLICISLNQRLLHQFFTVFCKGPPNLLAKYYYDWSYVRSPVWRLVRAELKLLTQFVFNLNPLSELVPPKTTKSPISKDGVQDMLVKHHLFSWDVE